MNETDARKLTHKQLTDLRKRAVLAVQNGESPAAVAKVFGVTRAAVYNWVALYRGGGWGELDAKKRGGRKPKLNGEALRWVFETVTMKNPMQLKFSFALWNSVMVGKVIWDKFRIKLSKASVCRLLNQLGLSPQRPLWRAQQQDPMRVQKWLDEEFPQIKQLAKKTGAEIWFGDEAGVRSDSHSGTTWARKGFTPIVETTGARFGINVISAVSPTGNFRFMCVEGRVSSQQFIEFLSRLIRGVKNPIFLIVDGHSIHKSAAVIRYVEKHADKLRLFYLPPYSPELNPDELVWNDLKNNGIGRQVIAGPDHLKKMVQSFLLSLLKMPERVMAYFREENVRYVIT